MTSFQSIYDIAAKNRGSVELLEAILPKHKSPEVLADLTDDRYLSMMTRCIFRAGFVWRVIDNKWPGFESAFANFNPMAVAHFSDERGDDFFGASTSEAPCVKPESALDMRSSMFVMLSPSSIVAASFR